MGYRGRPSGACFACRSRRIKCDKKKPMCTQCTRMRIACSGYRDPLEENFRDESTSVVERAQKSYCKRNNKGIRTETLHEEAADGRSTKNRTIKKTTISFRDDRTTTMLTLCPYLSVSVEDIALAYFMTSFIPGSRFDYIPQMYSQLDTSSALYATVRAVSIASLSQEFGQRVAHRSYAQALLATNAALSDPSTATTDATLVSILLLGLFEAVMWMSSQTPQSWKAHTQGALALINLRGKRQLETTLGRKLFRQVANIICVNSMQARSRLPAEMIELLQFAGNLEGEAARYRLVFLTCEVSNLMATINERSITTQDALDAAWYLDSQYVILAESLALDVPYQTVLLEEPLSGVYGLSHHQYFDHRVAQLWNTVRITRILLNETIHARATCLGAPLAALTRAKALQNVHQMTVDICASVPQFINFEPLGASCQDFREVISAAGSGSVSYRASTVSLLLPLSVVCGADFTIESVRAYAKERLRSLGCQLLVPKDEWVGLQSHNFEMLQERLYMFYVS